MNMKTYTLSISGPDKENAVFINSENVSNQINKILIKNSLTKETNPFFKMAPMLEIVSLQNAYTIAINWLEITKTFMLSSVQALGSLADKIMNDEKNSENRLVVLQTGFSVISDDLNNAHPIFSKYAPKGINGIHYKWWNASIVEKLANLVSCPMKITNETYALLSKMDELAKDYMGIAIQLRVVEAIAYDIATAFHSIFGGLRYNGEPLFAEDDMLWITSHMEAEAVHNEEVSNEISGMLKIAKNRVEQDRMLKMIDEYCRFWSDALDSFRLVMSSNI